MYPKLIANEIPLEGVGRHTAEILIKMLGGEEAGFNEPIRLS